MMHCGEPIKHACHVAGHRAAWFCAKHMKMAQEIVFAFGNVLIVEDVPGRHAGEPCKVRCSDFSPPEKAKKNKRRKP